jgi:hypothetical protein
MDHTKTEVNAVEETIKEAAETQIRELLDQQLAYVGGGIAEVAPC